MKIYSYSEARQNLSAISDSVCNNSKEEERIANVAVSRREKASSEDYVEAEAFWDDLNV